MRNHERKRERAYFRETRAVDKQISALEKKLDAARRRIGELADDIEAPGPRLERSRIALMRSGHDGRTAILLGAPILLRMRRRFDGRIPEPVFEHMLEHVRETTNDSGTVEMMPDSLMWSSSPGKNPVQPHWMVRIIVKEGVPADAEAAGKHHECFTTLTVTDRLDALAGRMFGAFGGILGTGGLVAPVAASIAFPALTPVFVVGWLGGVYSASRFLYRKIARGRAKALQHLFGILVGELEPHIK